MMSDNLIKYKERNHDDPFDYELDDLILRRDAMEAVENEDNLHGAMDSVWDGAFRRTKRAAVRVIAGVSAVPHEMTAKELLLTEARMLSVDEDAYDEYSDFIWSLKIDEAVAYVEKWAREHPKETN